MSRTTVNFSKLRALVVENHSLMRRLLGEMLRGFDIHDLRFAKDVPGAIELVYGEPVDFIILDFFLGELDGADFAKLIRHDVNCCNRKVNSPDHRYARPSEGHEGARRRHQRNAGQADCSEGFVQTHSHFDVSTTPLCYLK